MKFFEIPIRCEHQRTGVVIVVVSASMHTSSTLAVIATLPLGIIIYSLQASAEQALNTGQLALT